MWARCADAPCAPAPPQLTTLDSNPVARVGASITITTGGTCPTVDSMLYKGQFWYAYFNQAALNFNCCGTTISGSSP